MPQFYRRPTLDMTPDGQFVGPRPAPRWVGRVAAWAILIAAMAVAIAVGAFAFWVVLMLIPVAIIAGLVAWLALRFQLWRVRRSVGGERGPFRPPGSAL